MVEETGLVGMKLLFPLLAMWTLVPLGCSQLAVAQEHDGYPPAPDERAAVRAFRGAEGYGAWARGGRGGDVFRVTSLADAGPGSLREGIETADGPRTIVFAVGGTIDLERDLSVRRPFLTIAGQTAPGDGITLRGRSLVIQGTHDVVVRYLRCRPGDVHGSDFQGDSLTVTRCRDVIVDHVSASWSVDETLSVTHSTDVTVQWCLISESLHDSVHDKGPHGMGSLMALTYEGRMTWHHDLWAFHNNRLPRPGSLAEADFPDQPGLLLDLRLNVIHDWGGRHAGYTNGSSDVVRMNYVGNTLTDPQGRAVAFHAGSRDTRIHQRDNRVNGEDPGWGAFSGRPTREAEPFAVAPEWAVREEDPVQAAERVLAGAGASLVRDACDRRVVEAVRAGEGGIIDSQDEVGGWPDLEPGQAPADGDGDGMPDSWERGQGFDPADPADRNADHDGDGWTNLEEYLDALTAD
jgi:hypothetical protein